MAIERVPGSETMNGQDYRFLTMVFPSNQPVKSVVLPSLWLKQAMRTLTKFGFNHTIKDNGPNFQIVFK